MQIAKEEGPGVSVSVAIPAGRRGEHCQIFYFVPILGGDFFLRSAGERFLSRKRGGSFFF